MIKIKSKTGKEIIVRSPEMGDLEELLTMSNELIKEDTFMHLPGEAVKKGATEKWLKEAIKNSIIGNEIFLFAFSGEKLIGTCGIKKSEYKNRQPHLGTLGISIRKDFRDKGIGVKLIEIILKEAKQRGLKLVKLGVYANNERGIHVYEKLGFKKYGKLPKAVLYQGKYIDDILMHKEL